MLQQVTVHADMCRCSLIYTQIPVHVCEPTHVCVQFHFFIYSDLCMYMRAWWYVHSLFTYCVNAMTEACIYIQIFTNSCPYRLKKKFFHTKKNNVSHKENKNAKEHRVLNSLHQALPHTICMHGHSHSRILACLHQSKRWLPHFDEVVRHI